MMSTKQDEYDDGESIVDVEEGVRTGGVYQEITSGSDSPQLLNNPQSGGNIQKRPFTYIYNQIQHLFNNFWDLSGISLTLGSDGADSQITGRDFKGEILRYRIECIDILLKGITNENMSTSYSELSDEDFDTTTAAFEKIISLLDECTKMIEDNYRHMYFYTQAEETFPANRLAADVSAVKDDISELCQYFTNLKLNKNLC